MATVRNRSTKRSTRFGASPQSAKRGWFGSPEGFALRLSREGFRACEEITYNAETAEPAEKNAYGLSACSASSAFNVVFLHKLLEAERRWRDDPQRARMNAGA